MASVLSSSVGFSACGTGNAVRTETNFTTARPFPARLPHKAICCRNEYMNEYDLPKSMVEPDFSLRPSALSARRVFSFLFLHFLDVRCRGWMNHPQFMTHYHHWYVQGLPLLFFVFLCVCVSYLLSPSLFPILLTPPLAIGDLSDVLNMYVWFNTCLHTYMHTHSYPSYKEGQTLTQKGNSISSSIRVPMGGKGQW